MAYRGYWELNCAELANTNRVVAHLTGEGCGHCRNLKVPYDDSWPDLAYHPEPPWFSPSVAASSEFVGVWVMNVVGLDSVPVSREVADLICSGGVAAPHRDSVREMQFEALVVGCTNRGARFGLNWLSCRLRAGANNAGVELNFYAAHPEDMAEDPDNLWRSVRGTVLTQNAQVTEYAGLGGAQRNRQASVFRVTWTLAALNPYVYARPTEYRISTVPDPDPEVEYPWDTTELESIEWVHAPSCVTPESCELPVLFAAGCEPARIDIAPAVTPRCGGCMPLCDIEVRRWTAAPDPFTLCESTTVSVRVTNQSEEQLTLNTYWQPTGSVDPCERINHMQINGLPQYNTIVADSIGGRPYALTPEGARTRQVGIVTTPTGKPWSGATLDRGMSWDFVVESPPGAVFTTTVTFCERDS